MRHLFKTYYSYNYVLKQGKQSSGIPLGLGQWIVGALKRGCLHLKLLLHYFNSQSNFIQMAINHSDIRTRYFL